MDTPQNPTRALVESLHANPGGHGDVPGHEIDSAVAFLAR
ncbi:hypothetical protein GCM10011609_29810 [Lentzea pudingi]|uniref:Uncharacterized protein n=1 Tax=Lentzea pudingi TaxID=1789439 RepID=A0ABQ2HV68_9PSEU|nr:hypothetical protein GCM10011609_29810 [Lentzea pudingi]